ncbi:MAG: alpha/beta hydrolase [Bacteroidota bacterium]
MTNTFQYQNTTISYSDTGSGQIVVLLHGFGEDSHIFDRQVAFLKDRCRIIVPDLPGSGASVTSGGLSPEEANLCSSIDAMAECIAALIQSISGTPVVLLGHSMGGYITLAVAEKYPERLKAFGLLHSTSFADSEEKKAGRKKSIGFIQEHGAFAFLQTAIPALFAEGYQREHPAEVAGLVESGKQFTKEALVAYYNAMIDRPDRSDVLRGSKMPVLFVLGTEDKAVPMEDTLKQVHLPDVSYFHVLENVGHMGMWEATGQMNSFIIKFINDIE